MRSAPDSRLSSSLSIAKHISPPGCLTRSPNMYVNKFYSLVAAILLQLMGGLCYTFPLYSSTLKTALNVDQPSLEFIASCLLSGGYFSWIPGESPRSQEGGCLGPASHLLFKDGMMSVKR